MITRNRARIVAALGSATMKDFHSAEERELLAKLYEVMEANNEKDKTDKPAAVAPVKRRNRKIKEAKSEPVQGGGEAVDVFEEEMSL